METQTIAQEQQTLDLSQVVDTAAETPISITLVNYNESQITERLNITAAECQNYISKESFTWIHVQGQPKPSTLREFGNLFNLHPLALEDVIDIGERPKTEAYENQILVILGLLNKSGSTIINERVSLFLGDNFLVSFHSGENDPFRAVRRRLHHPQSALRNHKIDYLLYVLIDVTIDHCFPLLDEFDDEIEAVEQALLGPTGEETVNDLYTIKRELLVLRLKLRPQREAIRVLMRNDNDLLSDETKLYLRDCYDHLIRLVDILEIYREMTSNMLETHLSLVNNKTFHSNEVQRKATVWAVIFAPLTFITGIYGMNFLNVPELQWHYGFFICLGVMGGLGALLAWIFKRCGWL